MDERDEHQVPEDIEIETESVPEEDISIEDAEAMSNDKLKDLRTKLKQCEAEKSDHLEELQRAKADFLNARKRLDEERVADRTRNKIAHVEELLPLCDSFTMAMGDTAAWEEAPEKWRKGVEGIHAQLHNLLQQYGVKEVAPTGEQFDPQHHEAMGSEAVEDSKLVDTVVKVIQPGYTMIVDGTERQIRPARVIVGVSA
ncbi:MAG: nucleotide exchange factor GrpE [Patescibacteria group bacterium]